MTWRLIPQILQSKVNNRNTPPMVSPPYRGGGV
jgi:hypothetical protein